GGNDWHGSQQAPADHHKNLATVHSGILNIWFTKKASRKNGFGQAVLIQFNHGLTRINTDGTNVLALIFVMGSTNRRLPYPSMAYCTLPKRHFRFPARKGIWDRSGAL